MSKVSNFATNDTRLCEGQAGLGAPAPVVPSRATGFSGAGAMCPSTMFSWPSPTPAKMLRPISTLRDAAIDAITAVGPVDYHNRVFSGTLSWT